MSTRPRPLRVAATVSAMLPGALSALVAGNVIDVGQSDALTGLTAAVLTVLAAFGVPVLAERAVTPLVDPRDRHGDRLTPPGR